MHPRKDDVLVRPAKTPFHPPFVNPAVPLRGGVVLSGRYRIVAQTHQGDGWRIYQARDVHTGKYVTIKQLPRPDGRREAHLLKGLHHPMLPRCFRVLYKERAAYLVLSLVEGTALLRLSKRSPGRRVLPVEHVLGIGQQLADLLLYLHSQPKPVLLNDLQLRNVLCQENGKLLLIEFGMVRRCRTVTKTKGKLGSLDVEDARRLLRDLLPESVPSEVVYLVGGRPDVAESALQLRAALGLLAVWWQAMRKVA